MNANVKKLIRSAQTSFPFLLDFKFAVMRNYRRWRRIPFERDFEALALFPESPEALYLDVGANRGQSTEAILMMTKAGRIQQFEPNPLLCEKLTALYGRNSRVVTNATGLGDISTEQPLYVPFYKKWMYDGLASFDPNKAGDWLKGRVYFYKETHLSLRKTTCRIKKLDELGLSPFFIKLDIQGYEYQALKGGEQTLRRCEPILLIESPPEEEIVSYLAEFGYEMFGFKGGKFFPGMVGSHNTFFMTPQKSRLVERLIERRSPAKVEADVVAHSANA